jgi:hypothetical protein
MTTNDNNPGVLAVLDKYPAPEMRQARDAVAELLAAAEEMNRLAKGPGGGVSQAEKRAIVTRMDAAIARCKGGAK